MSVNGAETGYVALLDVLGFSALIGQDTDGSKSTAYLNAVRSALRGEERTGIDYVVFSDSIVLTAGDFHVLARGCSVLFWTLLNEGIALRGAIAYGSYVRAADEDAKTGVFVAGPAVIDAYRFEKAQDWIGIMLAPSVYEKHDDLKMLCDLHSAQSLAPTRRGERLQWAGIIQPAQIPFHGDSPLAGNQYIGFAIVPTNGISSATWISKSLDGSLHEIDRFMLRAPDPRAQNKYAAARRWLEPIRNRLADLGTEWDD